MLYSLAGEVRRACSFVIRIDMPLQTAKDILEFLLRRKILLETMQMQSVGGGEAMLILHCHVEKDRMKHLQHGLEKLNGILSVDLLESKGSSRSVPVPLVQEFQR
ncbi:MAG TPA: hypothetical protein VK563_05560 [Puia sp.]|nr:hypothetical protein [Puia sp.]